MTALSVASILAESARRDPDKVAVVDGDRRITYAELWREARGYAAALSTLGVTPGTTVALLAPNVAEFPRAYFAILASGAVVVPVHLLLTAEEMAYVLRDSGARLLICHAAQYPTGVEAAARAGVPVASLGPLPAGADPARHLPDVAASREPVPTFAGREAEDPAVIFYTSGTTGEPKGAVLTQLNIVLNTMINTFDIHEARADDVVLGCLPLFHSFGQVVAMNGTFRTGATLVLLPRFTGPAALELMVREHVTVFHGVPTMYIALLEAAAGAERLPELRLCVSGGASLPVAVLERFNAAFHTTIYEGYGLSETSPTATTNQPRFGTRAGTVGHAIWGVDVQVARAEVDERVELLPPGELGEIVIRGHNVFAGYLNRPEETARAMVDGWFRTGDLGTVDERGFVTIVDRKKDIIIRGGFNVYPREVEEAMVRHPGIAQVAVIGVPDEVHGEEICAVVVPNEPATDDAATLDEAALIEWCREHLGRHKYPRRVYLVDKLPLGPSLKVLKRELRRTYGGEPPADSRA